MEHFFSNGWCVLQVRGGALFIVLQGRYQAWRQLQAGKTVVLNFHAKGGAPEVDRWGRPASPRPACLGIVPSGANLLWMAWIISWSRL